MKDKLKSSLQRIGAGALALVFAGTIALPKAEAVTGVDDVSVGIMAVLVHLESIGGSLAVQQGTALATQNAVTALATQAGVAGALGTGVTGTAALATIGGAVTVAAAGGFTIGYVGYEQLSKLVEWIRKSKLTGTAENKIYTTGGRYNYLSDGKPIRNSDRDPINTTPYNYGQIYTTEGGSSFKVDVWENGEDSSGNKLYQARCTGVTVDNKIIVEESGRYTGTYMPTGDTYYIWHAITSEIALTTWYNWNHVVSIPLETSGTPWKGVFSEPDTPTEKQEVTYVPPVTWSPPAPTLGQDVYYNPYPNAPQKPIKEIVEDVPKDIYDKKFDPAPPSILDPSIPPITPPTPDIPTVNPNPDVTAPDDVKPYTVRLGDVFPFCIPFDIYHMVTLFAAEPEAPHAKWEFSLPFTGGTYEIEWDLREWDEVAALCRKLELILFCVGLAVVTSKLIKW
jgi:hypothetical protein